MRISFSVLGVVIVFCGTGLAAIIHVSGHYPTIQNGIDAAISGDTVPVVPGTLPGTPPGPFCIPLQSLVGTELKNLFLLTVE